MRAPYVLARVRLVAHQCGASATTTHTRHSHRQRRESAERDSLAGARACPRRMRSCQDLAMSQHTQPTPATQNEGSHTRMSRNELDGGAGDSKLLAQRQRATMSRADLNALHTVERSFSRLWSSGTIRGPSSICTTNKRTCGERRQRRMLHATLTLVYTSTMPMRWQMACRATVQTFELFQAENCPRRH